MIARGNRDFMLGEQFARDTGATLLGDETVIDVAGCADNQAHGIAPVKSWNAFSKRRFSRDSSTRMRPDLEAHRYTAVPRSARASLTKRWGSSCWATARALLLPGIH